jgi:hypothetical protein
MVTHTGSARLRLVVILSILSQLSGTHFVRRREDDPLQNATWWRFDYHSAIMVVVLGTVVTTALIYVLVRTGHARWWSCALAGALTGLFPGLFYSLATPAGDIDWVPVGPMMVSGLTAGIFTGLISYFVTKRQEVVSEA